MADQQPAGVEGEQLFQADKLGGRSIGAYRRYFQANGLQHAAGVGVRAVHREAVFTGNAKQYAGA